MGQATILAAGKTATVSSDVVVSAGAEVKIGMFAAAATPSVSMRLMLDTPGADLYVCDLTPANPVVVVSGPGTFRVVRPLITVDHGAFSET